MIRRIARSTSGLVGLVSMLFALATVVIGLAVYRIAHEELERQLDHRITAESHALLSEPDDVSHAQLAAAIARRETLGGVERLGYLLVDRSGRRIAGAMQASAPTEPGYVEFLRLEDRDRYAQALTTRLSDGSRLVVAADRTIIGEIDRTIAIAFGGALLAMLVLAASGGWLIGTLTKARFERIDRAALAIAQGDLSRRIPTDGSQSEFDRLASTLNHMLDRIGSLMDNLRQVSSDVAHDLRMPLTRLRNRLEDAQREIPDEGGRTAIAAATAQADELLEIFAALLRISEVEARGMRNGFRPLRFDTLIDDLAEAYRPDAEAGGRSITVTIQPGIELIGDRRLIQQLVGNLLDNALRHTPAGTAVAIDARSTADAIWLTISDDGPGIPTEDRARIFQRFARSERSRSSSGHGLGLALVAAIAHAHDGAVALTASPGFGVTLTLPRRSRGVF